MTNTALAPYSSSRRRFLKAGCLAGAAVGLTVCGGASLLVALTPEDQAPIALSSSSYGTRAMNNRVLIAYATYAGSTAEVSAELGKTLAERGLAVDVKPIRENPSIEGYAAVVVGSAVQYGNWLPEAVEFVKSNQQALNSVPAALFCVHITNTGNDEQSRRTRLTFLDQVRPLVPRATEAFFVGKFDKRGAARLLPGIIARFMPTYDLRDWTKIRSWAKALSI